MLLYKKQKEIISGLILNLNTEHELNNIIEIHLYYKVYYHSLVTLILILSGVEDSIPLSASLESPTT